MTDSWEEFDDGIYAHKTILYNEYSLQYNNNNTALHIAVADYGGPVAVVPDIIDDSNTCNIFYNGKGKLINSSADDKKKSWNKVDLGLQRQSSEGDISNEVVSIGWTSCQSLVIVLRCAEAIIYRGPADVTPEKFTLAELQPGDLVQLAIVEGNCLSMLTSSMQLFVSCNLESNDPYCVRYPDPPLDPTRPPSDMLIMPLDDMYEKEDDVMEVMIPLYPSGVVLMTSTEAKGQLAEWNNSPIVAMNLHPSKDKVIVCTFDMQVSVLSLDFEKKFFSVNISDSIDIMEMPKHVGWCGSSDKNSDINHGIVLLTFDRPPWCPDGAGSVGVSSTGECITWDIKKGNGSNSNNSNNNNSGEKQILGCVQELDCVRIFTSEEHCRIEMVPTCAVGLFSIASTEPSAMLKDAWDALANGDPNADEGLNLLIDGDNLDDAVENCLSTALFQSDLKMQRSLLAAAAYGARASPDNADDLNEAVREATSELRILNVLKNNEEIAMALTSEMYRKLSLEVLIDRLLLCNMHKLAIGICTSMRLPKDNVIVHWLCRKIENSSPATISDLDLLKIINKKLAGYDDVSVSSIAQIAHHCGRRELALKIMEREPLARGKILSLLSMEEHKRAIATAFASFDTELVYFTIMQAKKVLTQQEFIRLLNDSPGAEQLMFRYWKQSENHDEIAMYINLSSCHFKSGRYFVEEASKHMNTHAGRGFLTYAKSAFKKAVESTTKNELLRAKAMEKIVGDREKLETFQGRLSSNLVGRSLSQTILDAVCRQQLQMAEELTKQFNFPKKSYYLLKVKGLAMTHAWEALEIMAKSRNVVKEITMRPFVEACLNEKARDIAVNFAMIAIDKRVQMECFILLKIYEEAGELAIYLKDQRSLMMILQMCNDPQVAVNLKAKAERKISGEGSSRCAQQ